MSRSEPLLPSEARPGLLGRPEPRGGRLSGTQDSAFGSLGLNMGSRGQSRNLLLPGILHKPT